MPRTPPKRILVADDHRDNADATALLLQHACEDVEVDVGYDGARALALAIERRPAVALLDIEMPVLTGVQAALAIRHALGPSAPVLIAMTGNLLRAAAVETHLAFDHVLVKPVDLDKLFRLIEEA